MKKYIFSFLFLFFSACSSDLESDKSDHPFTTQTHNEAVYQNKKSHLVIDQDIEMRIDVDAGSVSEREAVSVAEASTVVEADSGSEGIAGSVAEADSGSEGK